MPEVDIIELIFSSDGDYDSGLAVAGIADFLGWEVVDPEIEEIMYEAPQLKGAVGPPE